MDTYSKLFDICIVLSGVYMLYSAYTGKGSLYKTDNIKKGKEAEYLKLIRPFCLIGGVLATAQGALDYFKIEPYAMILFVLLCVVLVGFCFLFFRYAKRQG